MSSTTSATQSAARPAQPAADKSDHIIIRTDLAKIPFSRMDTDRREFSKCLVVPTKFDTLACVTDSRCLAVTQVSGEVARETAFDLDITTHAKIKFPMMVRRKDGESEFFRCAEIDGRYASIGPRFRMEDKSDPEKFPGTSGILEPVGDTTRYQVIRISAKRLQMLAAALNEHDDIDQFVSLLIPPAEDVRKLRVVGESGIGVLMTADPDYGPKNDEIIARFNGIAERFNRAREDAAATRKREFVQACKSSSNAQPANAQPGNVQSVAEVVAEPVAQPAGSEVPT